MKITRRDAKAQAVWAAMMDLIEHDQVADWHVEPYVNGREIGLSIQELSKRVSVAFSENRNSDDIVVYHIPEPDRPAAAAEPAFSSITGLNDKAYANAKYFGRDEYVNAARFILDVLKAKHY